MVVHVHTVWIGPPDINSRNDISGIAELEKRAVSGGIEFHFWCLNEFTFYYSGLFQGRLIKVHSIEVYLMQLERECVFQSKRTLIPV